MAVHKNKGVISNRQFQASLSLDDLSLSNVSMHACHHDRNTFFLKPSSCSLYPLIRTETRVTSHSHSHSSTVTVTVNASRVDACVGVFSLILLLLVRPSWSS
jgi:hypothetical protein